MTEVMMTIALIQRIWTSTSLRVTWPRGCGFHKSQGYSCFTLGLSSSTTVVILMIIAKMRKMNHRIQESTQRPLLLRKYLTLHRVVLGLKVFTCLISNQRSLYGLVQMSSKVRSLISPNLLDMLSVLSIPEVRQESEESLSPSCGRHTSPRSSPIASRSGNHLKRKMPMPTISR